MHLSWFDIALILSAWGFVWGGFTTGLIQAIGGVIGLFVGATVASRTYEHFAGWVAPVFNGSPVMSKLFAFVLIFLLVTRLVGLVFWLVNKIFHLIAIIPGLKLVNKLGGAVFGFIEASLFLGITMQFLVRLPIATPFAQTIHDSRIAGYFLGVAGWLLPLLPSVLRQAQDATKNLLPK